MELPLKKEVVDLPIIDLEEGNYSTSAAHYRKKDQYKSDFSNKFIGRGNGSTGEYARLTKLAGLPVNGGQYNAHDVVFISANGNRKGGSLPDKEEILRAIEAQATFLTDSKINRPEEGHFYNTGEQIVADFLRSNGYVEKNEFNNKVARWHKAGCEPAFIVKKAIVDRVKRKVEMKWSRKSDNGFEVSSKGGKELEGSHEFSAMNAKLKDGRTIEEAYQLDVKGYRSFGSDWRIGKGKEPLIKMTREVQYQKYKALWGEWCDENPGKLEWLERTARGKELTDTFGSSPVNQARALADLINERIYKITPQQEVNLFNQKQAPMIAELVNTTEHKLKTIPPKANFTVIKRVDPGLPVRLREVQAIYEAIPTSELNKYNEKANKGAQRIPVLVGTELECKSYAKGNKEMRELVLERIKVRTDLYNPLMGASPENLDHLRDQFNILTKKIKGELPVGDSPKLESEVANDNFKISA